MIGDFAPHDDLTIHFDSTDTYSWIFFGIGDLISTAGFLTFFGSFGICRQLTALTGVLWRRMSDDEPTYPSENRGSIEQVH